MKPKLTVQDLRLLPVVVTDFYQSDDKTYFEIMDKNILELSDEHQPLVTDPPISATSTVPALILSEYGAVINFMSFVIFSTPSAEIEKMIDEFFEIPLDDMPMYIICSKTKKSPSVRCPRIQTHPDETPQTWQTILARWRLRIDK